LLINQITPLLITYNERLNLPRVLDKLSWAQRIVAIDSGSTDETVDILRGNPRVAVLQRPFVNFADQCNFGLMQIATTWALSLDADYELSDAFVDELYSLSPDKHTVGFRARFIYRIHGRPIRCGLYPPRVVLYRKDEAHYRNEGHGHRVVINGNIVEMRSLIYHDDRKPLSRWMASQLKYGREEADYLTSSSKSSLSRVDKLRLIGWPAPIVILFYVLVLRGGLADGWAGWHYALQRLISEVILALEIVDRRLAKDAPSNIEQP
jgi:glycosyltransferase involved in cell wall biosynthesis